MLKNFKDMKGVIAIATTPFDNENLIKTINDMNKNYHKEYMKIKKLSL